MKFLTATALFLIIMVATRAQPPGCCMGSGMPGYNISTETTITGTVQDVIHPRGRGWSAGTHLMVKTDGGTVEVHLGPSAYISKQGFTFAKNDGVTIVGSKATVSGKDAIIAREVSKDGKKLALRDEAGRPLWAGRGRP